MKLTNEEIRRSETATPLQLFEQGTRAETTRRKYVATLRRITCEVLEDVLEGDFEARVNQFVQKGKDNPNWMMDLLISLSWKLRERTEKPKDDADYLNPTSYKTYFKPLRKLLEMNDVAVNWKRVYATFPEKDNMLDTKGWTKEEIAAILAQARDPMEKAIVLLLASSGMRRGGLIMTWGDIKPVYMADGRLTTDAGEGGELACVALNVYAGSPERYTAFATPEAYDAIQEYGRMWERLMKCKPEGKDTLFLATKLLPRPASEPAIARRIQRMAFNAGLRDPGSKNGPRFETQLVHGFRKFFNKTCKEALSGDSLAALIRTEYMMGHVGLVSLDQNYFKTNMLEMAADYVKVVPALTINDSKRLKQAAEQMSANIRELEDEKNTKIAELEKKIAGLERQNEDIKAERDAVSGADSKLVADLARRLQSQDEAISKMREEHDADMKEMRADYENRPLNLNAIIAAIRRSPGADEVLDVIQERVSASGKENGPNVRRRRSKQSGDEVR